MPVRYVHLVRHGSPLVDHEHAPSDWHLDPAGVDRVRSLADSARLPTRATWFSSPEPKARETARILTDRPVTVVAGLREQVRLHVGRIADFPGVLGEAFARPARPAYDGWEALDATRARAARTVRDLLREHPRGDIVLVGHATHLALVVEELTGAAADPAAVNAMAMPDVLSIRMGSDSSARPLLPGQMVLLAATVVAVELLLTLLTGRAGIGVLAALVLAAAATLARRTRDLGVSLLVGVLLAAFVVLSLDTLLRRLPH